MTRSVNQSAEIETSSSWDVKVYPNPSSGPFNLYLQGTNAVLASVSLFDVQGRVIDRFNITANQIKTIGNNLKSGIYFAEIIHGKKVTTIRLVKK
jgi:hypothetical protein